MRRRLVVSSGFVAVLVMTVFGFGTPAVAQEKGMGLSGLFYVRQWDDLHLYVSPRWTYSHGSSSSSTLPIDTGLNSWSLTGSVGAQCALGKRFGVFGEVGFGYQHSHETGGSLIQTDITSHTIGTRTGVGVILALLKWMP